MMFYSENEFVQVCGGLGGVFSLFENNQFHFGAFLQRLHRDGLVIVSIPLVPGVGLKWAISQRELFFHM